MTIEELAFKDRKNLTQLNEKDLLDIIEFLQIDRKQWINQFTQTHNESIEIQEENQELKKQLEEYQKDIKDLDNQNKRAFENMQLNQLKVCNMIKQQKEFILYLRHLSNWYSADGVKQGMVNEILQKYKSIIGVENENN